MIYIYVTAGIDVSAGTVPAGPIPTGGMDAGACTNIQTFRHLEKNAFVFKSHTTVKVLYNNEYGKEPFSVKLINISLEMN